MRKALFAAAAAILASAPAFAADMPASAPVYKAIAPMFSWSGFYAGGNIGGAWSRTTSSNMDPFGGFDEGAPESGSPNASGFMGGGQIGYNWQTGNWVAGIESDLGYLNLKKSVTPAVSLDNDIASAKWSWYATLTGRLGIAADRNLFYLKGGAAWARIKNIATDVDGGVIDPLDFSESNRTRLGWALGAGWEYAFAPRWSMKLEYLYMDFNKVFSGNIDGDVFEHKNSVHTAKIGLNYLFGDPGKAPVSAKY